MATETITEEMVTENKDWRMTHEENRVNSLKGWPLSRGKCVKTELASAGFYSCKAKGQPRKTRCFCCLVEISDWKQNDHPIEKHLAASPDCPYARFGGNQSHLTVDQFRAVVQTRNANVLKLKMRLQREIVKATIAELEKLIDA